MNFPLLLSSVSLFIIQNSFMQNTFCWFVCFIEHHDAVLMNTCASYLSCNSSHWTQGSWEKKLQCIMYRSVKLLTLYAQLNMLDNEIILVYSTKDSANGMSRSMEIRIGKPQIQCLCQN